MSSESKYENSGGRVLHMSFLKFSKFLQREKTISIHYLNSHYSMNVVSPLPQILKTLESLVNTPSIILWAFSCKAKRRMKSTPEQWRLCTYLSWGHPQWTNTAGCQVNTKPNPTEAHPLPSGSHGNYLWLSLWDGLLCTARMSSWKRQVIWMHPSTLSN